MSAVSKASVDNKGCLFAALAKVMAVMQDTLREVRVPGSRVGLWLLWRALELATFGTASALACVFK